MARANHVLVLILIFIVSILVSLIFVVFKSTQVSFAQTLAATTSTSSEQQIVPESVVPPADVSVKPAVAPSPDVAVSIPTAITQVGQLEDLYFGQTGSYLQIKEDGQLPEYETGTVASKLGQAVPSNVRVDVYDGPRGKGYVVFYSVDDGKTITRYRQGYGPHADEWTSKQVIPHATASSTPQQ